MKKKLMLTCFGVFIVVFLLWPATGQSVPCGPNADCEVSAKVGIGGGARAIDSLISRGNSAKSTGFKPAIAFIGSAAIAIFVYTTASSYRRKDKRVRHKRT